MYCKSCYNGCSKINIVLGKEKVVKICNNVPTKNIKIWFCSHASHCFYQSTPFRHSCEGPDDMVSAIAL